MEKLESNPCMSATLETNWAVREDDAGTATDYPNRTSPKENAGDYEHEHTGSERYIPANSLLPMEYPNQRQGPREL